MATAVNVQGHEFEHTLQNRFWLLKPEAPSTWPTTCSSAMVNPLRC